VGTDSRSSFSSPPHGQSRGPRSDDDMLATSSVSRASDSLPERHRNDARVHETVATKRRRIDGRTPSG
jgi:hypothetical protein